MNTVPSARSRGVSTSNPGRPANEELLLGEVGALEQDGQPLLALSVGVEIVEHLADRHRGALVVRFDAFDLGPRLGATLELPQAEPRAGDRENDGEREIPSPPLREGESPAVHDSSTLSTLSASGVTRTGKSLACR
jgi:hypothetical protein